MELRDGRQEWIQHDLLSHWRNPLRSTLRAVSLLPWRKGFLTLIKKRMAASSYGGCNFTVKISQSALRHIISEMLFVERYAVNCYPIKGIILDPINSVSRVAVEVNSRLFRTSRRP